MKIHRLKTFGYHSNCYVISNYDNDGKCHGVIIDPTCPTDKIIDFVRESKINIDMIILTHGHFDHTVYIDDVRDMLNVPVYIHDQDNEMLTDSLKNAYSVFFGGEQTHNEADVLLRGNEKIPLGNSNLEIISTPGHSKGSICILGDGFLVTGDTLFAEGYGRYDLHGASSEQLIASLKSLATLNKDLRIYPGHGNDELLGNALRNIFII